MSIINQFKTINCGGNLLDLSDPIVMGILNLTPDSFFDGNKFSTEEKALKQVEKMLNEGASIIDVGGMSSRPGAKIINEEEELKRVLPIIQLIQKNFPKAVISVDTWRWEIAQRSVEAGATMINDISAGSLDENLWPNLSKLNVPYVLMHMQGIPKNMQTNPNYENVSLDIMDSLSAGVTKLRELGVKDIIVDPGFGFGKTIEHNFKLLKDLNEFKIIGCPLLVGLSRKSMIHKLLNILPINALNGTTASHMLAMLNGANILRVHDVSEAKECIQIFKTYRDA